MTKYLFDTNILSYLYDDTSPFHEKINRRYISIADDDDVCVSILSIYELDYRIAHAGETLKPELEILKSEVLEIFEITSLSLEGSKLFGELKKQYQEHTGVQDKPLQRHNFDIILASSALKENAVLVSNDRIFKNLAELITDFQFENWAI